MRFFPLFLLYNSIYQWGLNLTCVLLRLFTTSTILASFLTFSLPFFSILGQALQLASTCTTGTYALNDTAVRFGIGEFKRPMPSSEWLKYPVHLQRVWSRCENDTSCPMILMRHFSQNYKWKWLRSSRSIRAPSTSC